MMKKLQATSYKLQARNFDWPEAASCKLQAASQKEEANPSSEADGGIPSRDADRRLLVACSL